ncbi:hypothetical protein BJF83_21350 [Nocardiopsis sp. CNR-923]|nr:hypothetical protein BJF83_21350 [Nocardiopsis sp. CNR-923]
MTATPHDGEDGEDDPLAVKCRKSGADVGRPCHRWCVYAPADPENVDSCPGIDGTSGVAGHPGALIEGILGGGL